MIDRCRIAFALHSPSKRNVIIQVAVEGAAALAATGLAPAVIGAAAGTAGGGTAALTTAPAVAGTAALAATAWLAVEHFHFRVKALQHDIGRIAVVAGLVLPLAGLQLALEIDLAALAQIFFGDAGEALVIDRDIVPLGLFLALAGLLVLPAFRCRDAEIADLAAVRKGADFRILAQIAYDDDFVDAAGHYKFPKNYM